MPHLRGLMGKIFSGSTCSLSRDKPESYINPYTLGAQIWVRRCDEDHTLLRCVADPKSKRTTQMDTPDENAPRGRRNKLVTVLAAPRAGRDDRRPRG
jgi:hypothetical protein